MKELHQKLFRSSLCFLVVFLLLVSFLCVFFSNQLMMKRLIAAKQQEVLSLSTRVQAIYDEAEYTLSLTAFDNRMLNLLQRVEESTSLYSKSDNVQMCHNYLMALLANQPRFRAIYVISDTYIIGLSDRNFSCYKELDQPLEIIGPSLQKSLYLAMKNQLVNDQFGGAVLMEQLVISDCGSGRYLVGVLDFNEDLHIEETSVLLLNEQQDVVYSEDDWHTILPHFVSPGQVSQEVAEASHVIHRRVPHAGTEYLVVLDALDQETLIQCVAITNLESIHQKTRALIRLIILLDILLIIIFGGVAGLGAKHVLFPLKCFSEIVAKTTSFVVSKELARFLQQYRRRLRLRFRISFYYCLNFIPLFIIILTTTITVSDIIEQNTIDSYKKIIGQSAVNIESQMTNLKSYATLLALDEQVQRYLSADIENPENRTSFQSADSMKNSPFSLIPTLQATFRQNVFNLRLYNAAGRLVYSDIPAPNPQTIDQNKYGALFNISSSNNYWYIDSAQDGTYFLKKVLYYPVNDLGLPSFKCLGYVELLCGSLLSKQPAISFANSKSFECIIDAQNENKIIDASLSKWYNLDSVQNILSNHNVNADVYSEILLDFKEKTLLVMKPISGTRYALASLIPFTSIVSDTFWVLCVSLLLIIALLLTVFLAAKLFTHKLLLPLSNFCMYMQDVEFYSPVAFPFDKNHDEFYDLFSSFKDMLERLEHLGETVRLHEIEHIQLEKRKKEAELIALQTQINPHFLYNIFVSINMLLRLGRSSEAQNMLSSAAQLFCLSIYRGNRIVPISEELQHVEVYLQIQRIRYTNKILYECQVEEALLSQKTPKLILQPLIENAIEHGLKHRLSIRIALRIAVIDERRYQIVIQDNGEGIEPDKLQALQEHLAQNTPTEHYGLNNVQERVRLYFGNDFGLAVESTFNEGTAVTITLPLVQSADTVESA